MAKVVNVMGINDANTVLVERNRGTFTQLELTIGGSCDLLQQIGSRDFEVLTLILGGKLFDINFSLPGNTALFNSIACAEGNSKALQAFSQILTSTSAPVINHPDHVARTTRNNVSQVLANIEGVVAPRCVKFTPSSIGDVSDLSDRENIPCPFLFRPAVEHGSHTLVRVDSPDDLDKLHRFALDGAREYYVTEYIDYRSADGLYRKARFLVIGDDVIPRHLMIASDWQIHVDEMDDSRIGREERIREEVAFLAGGDEAINRRCLGIKNSLELDFIGIDCAFDGRGNLIIFEANPYSMQGLGKKGPRFDNTIAHIRRALVGLIHTKTAAFALEKANDN
ncbi:MAG: hypothetical protein JRK53_04775 [Deltaproteobacteria bacterium]|nr:hypothetical protein [Deltaproteobacteria bacterium]